MTKKGFGQSVAVPTRNAVRFMRAFQKHVEKDRNNLQQDRQFFQDHLDKLDESFLKALPLIFQLLIAHELPETRQYFAQLFVYFGDLVKQFPQENQQLSLELSISAYQLALRIFNRENFPESWTEIQHRLGVSLQNLGSFKEAIDSYDEILRIKSDFHLAWYNRGVALYELGCLQESLDSYKEALKIKSDFHQAWCNQGIVLYQLGHLQESLDSYKEALKIRPSSYKSWHSQGVILDDLSHFSEAIASYGKALKIKPDFYEAWHDQGFALNNLGKYEEAIESYNKALKIKSNSHNAWFSRGLALNNLGKHEEAIESYEKALKIKSDYHDAWHNRGVTLNNLGKYEEAIASFEKALKIKSNFYQAWNNRGIALSNLDNKRAISNYNQGLQHVQRDTQPEGWGILYRGLGQIHYLRGYFDAQAQGRGDIDQALTSYYTACTTLKYFPESYLGLIQDLIKAYLSLGNLKQANDWRDIGLAVFRDLINVQPTNHQRCHLEAKFSGMSRIDVDVLIQSGQLNTALEVAERYKNRCLTHIFEQWQEDTLSPTYTQIQTLLSPTTALIYWHLSDDALTTFLLTPSAQTPDLLDADRLTQCRRAQDLATWLKTWNTDYSDYRTGSKEKKVPDPNHSWRINLADCLAKLQKLLGLDTLTSSLPTGITHLILIPHRDLHCLPLAACLPRFICTTLPSARVGINLQQRSTASTTATDYLLSIADPKVNTVADQVPLRYAQLESALLCALFSQHTHLDPATHAAVTTTLGEGIHTLFHFTGHGSYDPRSPKDSALQLIDYPLTAQDLYGLSLSSYKLISLSACETALTGRPTLNEEYVGLASALLQAGAISILSTLWNVSEVSTAYLVVKFYQLCLEGTSPAQALNLAQSWLCSVTYAELHNWLQDLQPLLPSHSGVAEYLGKCCIAELEDKMKVTEPPYRNPYYWAAFTLTGHSKL
jgi:CHAT domain-containing protein/tetratricopeptide (TPR) repeat protein